MQCDHHPDLSRRRVNRSALGRKYLEREIIIYFAGMAAERRFTGRRDTRGWQADFEGIYRLGRRVISNKEKLIDFGAGLYRCALDAASCIP